MYYYFFGFTDNNSACNDIIINEITINDIIINVIIININTRRYHYPVLYKVVEYRTVFLHNFKNLYSNCYS